MSPEQQEEIIADLCSNPSMKFSQREAVRRLLQERNNLRAAQPVAQMPELTEQIAVWLDEAADDVIGWGGYASEHFQKKHDLSGTAQAYRDRAASIRAALAASTAAATKGVCQHCLPIVGAELAGRCAAEKPEDKP